MTGTQFVYALTADERLTFDPRKTSAEPSVRLALTGELSLAVVGILGDQVDLQVQVRPSHFVFESEGQDSLNATTRPQMLEHLQAPFYVTLNSQGAALTTHFERNVDLVSQNLLRSLMASTQFVMPEMPRDEWQAQELDVTGQYVAAYRATPGEPRYEKKKERYLRLASPEGLRAIESTLRIGMDSTASFVLGKEDWPESVEAREHLVLDPGNGVPPVTADAQVSLRRTAVRNVPALIGSLELRRPHLVRTSLATQVFAAPDPKERLRRLVGGARLADLVDELHKLPRDEQANGPATSLLMSRLQALFSLDPHSAAEVPARLRGETDRNTYSSLLGSLSGASTPEAISALGQVVSDDQLPVAVRVDAAAALGMVELPTEAGTAALRDLTKSGEEDLRSTSTLALGNTARNLRTQKDPGADALVRELVDAVANAPTPEARALQLRALANAADPRTLQTIQDSLRDPSPVVREAAVEALRLIPSPDADRLIAAVMVEDRSPTVRRAAIFASSFRSLVPALPALERILHTDTVDAVRIDAVRLLGSNVLQTPGAGELLAWAGQHDPNDDVRHTARAFLAPRSVPQVP